MDTSGHQSCSLMSPFFIFHLEIKVPGCGRRPRRRTWLTVSRGLSSILSYGVGSHVDHWRESLFSQRYHECSCQSRDADGFLIPAVQRPFWRWTFHLPAGSCTPTFCKKTKNGSQILGLNSWSGLQTHLI